MTTSPLLPAGFEDLEPFAAVWALPDEATRLAKRMASDMPAILAFHDAMLPRVEAIFEYVDRYPLDALPPDVQRLMLLAMSLAEITPSVHFFKEPVPSDAMDPRRFKRWDVPNMTPEY